MKSGRITKWTSSCIKSHRQTWRGPHFCLTDIRLCGGIAACRAVPMQQTTLTLHLDLFIDKSARVGSFPHKCQRVSITLTARQAAAAAAAAASPHSWAAARYENLLFPPSLTCTHHINPMNLCIIFLLAIERLQSKIFSLWRHGCLSSISTVSLSNRKM